jgi:transcriptional regulator with XRE-family HTH domain
MATFNERLRRLRLEAGLTQEGLARLAGLTVSTVSKLEKPGPGPAWVTVNKLAAALGVSVADFTDEAGEPTSPDVRVKPPLSEEELKDRRKGKKKS